MPDGVFVHSDGLCESDSVGSGTRVWAFAHVLPGAVVGRECGQRLPDDLACSCGKSWTATDGTLRSQGVAQ